MAKFCTSNGDTLQVGGGTVERKSGGSLWLLRDSTWRFRVVCLSRATAEPVYVSVSQTQPACFLPANRRLVPQGIRTPQAGKNEKIDTFLLCSHEENIAQNKSYESNTATTLSNTQTPIGQGCSQGERRESPGLRRYGTQPT